jgi:hypothetical protein
VKEQPTKQQPGWVEHAAVGPGGVEVDADMAAALAEHKQPGKRGPRGIPPLRPRPVG